MIVSRLDVSGFRGIRAGTVAFQKFTALVGPNNCGKTTITEALALVLGRDRLVRPLTEHDFFGSDPQPQDRILIVATITGFEGNRHDRHPDWFRHDRAVIKWLDADDGTIKAASNKATDVLACQLAFAARFDREALETVSLRYFFDADTAVDPFDDESLVVQVPGELIRQVGLFLVPASRTWDRMISFGSELFRRVVSYVGGRPAEAVLIERDRLRNPVAPLEADPNLAQLIDDVNGDIRSLFGGTQTLKLRVTTTDSDGILDAIYPHFGEDGHIPLPTRRHGNGLISLQTLVLLMRFGRLRVERGEGFMMVIEEPELHVPPPLQRKLVRLMQSMATQTIVTTHSPTIASIPAPHEIFLAVNEAGNFSARPLCLAPLMPGAFNGIRKLFLTDRALTTSAIMHPHVLIPEGKTDFSWIQLLLKALELHAEDAGAASFSFPHEVGVLPVHDAQTIVVYDHMRQVHPSLACLFDGDAQGTIYEGQACDLANPPRTIIRWPTDWTIENVIGWVAEATPDVLLTPDLVATGVPDNAADLVAALRGRLKTDEIVHGLIADALAENAACRGRARRILSFIADVLCGREPEAGVAGRRRHANDKTVVWTFQNAIPRV